MARILYLVAGEGNGHATRSAAVIEELKIRGHEIIAVSDRNALDILKRASKNSIEAYTPRMSYSDNAVREWGTFFKNVPGTPLFLSGIRKVRSLVRVWKPQLVVTDFNPMSLFISGIPIISIDNQNIISKAKIDIPHGCFLEYIKSRAVVECFSLRTRFSIISSLINIPVRIGSAMVGPIISRKVKCLNSIRGGHVLVYQTSPTNQKLADLLPLLGVNIAAYGFGKVGQVGDVRFMPFNTKRWYKDLSSCKAVIMNGGFSLLSEALFLKKPVLCFPIRHQFEQILNAYYVEKCGFGQWGKQMTKEVILNFLEDERLIHIALGKKRWEDGTTHAVDIVEKFLTTKQIPY